MMCGIRQRLSNAPAYEWRTLLLLTSTSPEFFALRAFPLWPSIRTEVHIAEFCLVLDLRGLPCRVILSAGFRAGFSAYLPAAVSMPVNDIMMYRQTLDR